jgi:vacuolar-type H+-ATPase subunit F/Vma7
MMAARAPLAFVGDAVNAAGFRLAGAQVFVPVRGEEAAALAQARGAAQVVLLSGEVAEALPRAELEAAQAALQPLLAIVPEGHAISPADPAERVRTQLGLEK